MSRLNELLIAVKEQDLSRDQLEEYYSELCSLYGLTQLRLAELEKEEALFLGKSEAKTAVMATRAWSITDLGLELITRKRESKALEKIISSVKSRIFNQIG